jgi:hypothetical protein
MIFWRLGHPQRLQIFFSDFLEQKIAGFKATFEVHPYTQSPDNSDPNDPHETNSGYATIHAPFNCNGTYPITHVVRW